MLCCHIAYINSYLVADYERRNFSIYQMLWDGQAVSRLVSIPAEMNGTANRLDLDPQRTAPGTIAGATIGPSVLVVLIIALALYFWRRRQDTKKQAEKQKIEMENFQAAYLKPEMDGIGKLHYELEAVASVVEADSKIWLEIQGRNTNSASSNGNPQGIAELKGDDNAREIFSESY